MTAAKRRGRRRRLLLDVKAMAGRLRLQLVPALLMAAARRRWRLLLLLTTCMAVEALMAATTQATAMVEMA